VAALAGTFFFDMRPAHGVASEIHKGLDALAADEVSVLCHPGIAIGLGAVRLWEAADDGQPARSLAGTILTFDGRLDNRDDLLIQLHGGLAVALDAEIALAAYERWGNDAFARLQGEWSLAIWDPALRTLHLARDYIGVRPLFYVAGSHSVMWSSNLGELAYRSGRSEGLSETFVATAIVQEISPSITPYEGIQAVPPGTCVSFAADRREHRRRTYGALSSRSIRLRHDRDYEEAFRALWFDAVRARLRTAEPAWAELSGGLDSSSVVCTAHAILTAGRAPARSLRTISHATLESPEGDERRFIAEVEARTGMRSVVFGVEEYRARVDDDWDWVSPFAARGVLLACLDHVRASGSRLVLSGRMGDAVTGCQPDNTLAVCDDFAAGGFGAAFASLRRWSRATRRPFVSSARYVAHWLNPAFEDVSPADDSASLLMPKLRSLAADRSSRTERLDEVRPAKRRLARMLLGYARTSRLDLPLHPPGVIFSYPFSHRPLVDFMLGIPGSVVTAPGETRSLMRRALAPILPPRILARQSKGYYPPAALRSVRTAASGMLPVQKLEIVRRGWIDPISLELQLRALIDAGIASIGLRRVLRLEEWLGSRQRRGPAVMPIRKEVTSNGVHHA